MQTATAQIFITAFQALPEKEQLGIFHWIEDHKNDFEKLEKDIKIKDSITSDEFYRLSTESLSEIWNAPENDHWDEFLKDK